LTGLWGVQQAEAGLIFQVVIGNVIEADARGEQEPFRQHLPFVAEDHIAGTKNRRARIESGEAGGDGVVPVLLISGAPIDFIAFPGMHALLEVESQIVQGRVEPGIVHIAPVIGELHYGLAVSRTAACPACLQISTVVAAVSLDAIN